jgi:hypothetical protein
MYLQVVNQGRNAKKKQKKQAKNIRHNANRTKREQAAQKLKEDNILNESTRRREAKKQDFIKFIIDQTLSETDYSNYGYRNSGYQMQSAWELAIQLGPYFYWVIMDYDNFTMPDPDILNINRYSWDKTYQYSISQLPSLDYILNIALRNGCNHLIIERILKSGANPNRSSFDYISANIKIIKKNQDQIKKNKEKDDEFERYKIFEAEVCRDICFAQSQSSNSECTGKCVKIARESYYGDWDDYDDDDDDDDVTGLSRDAYSGCHRECHLMPPLCIAAASGIIETIKILIKYKANITERVLEYNQLPLPCFKDNNPYHYILTEYNVLNYVNRSLNTECIEFIKSEFKKIQSDKQSIRQCAISAILNKRSIKHNNVNCMYIQGIYNNVKSFMGNTPNPLIKYIPINTIYSNNCRIYKKANLHIHQSDIKKNVWILNRIPIFDIIKHMHHYNSYEFTSCNSGCYSFQVQYQPNRLPNIEYKDIGTIRIPKNKYEKLEVTIDNDLFGKTYQYNDDYEHYEQYIDFEQTQYPATCGKIAAPIRQDSITISCKFTGETESERINNMVQHYLLHKCVINTEIFGTYVFMC